MKKIKDDSVDKGPIVPCITAILSYSKGFACSLGPGTVWLFENGDNSYRRSREIWVNVNADNSDTAITVCYCVFQNDLTCSFCVRFLKAHAAMS